MNCSSMVALVSLLEVVVVVARGVPVSQALFLWVGLWIGIVPRYDPSEFKQVKAVPHCR